MFGFRFKISFKKTNHLSDRALFPEFIFSFRVDLQKSASISYDTSRFKRFLFIVCEKFNDFCRKVFTNEN